MTVIAGQLFVNLLVILQAAALVLHLAKRRQMAVWALLAGPAIALCVAVMTTGTAAFAGNNLKWVVFELAIIGLALLSFWRASLWFWLGWISNLAQLAAFFYLAFFWHVFS